MSHKYRRFQVTSKLIRPNRWITQTVRHRIPNCWARNGDSTSTECAATDSWNDELTATGRSQMLATMPEPWRPAHSNRRGTNDGACRPRQRWTINASLYCIRWGTSSQCRWSFSNCNRPRSNFPVAVVRRAAEFRTRWSLSVIVIGERARTEL